MVPTRDAGVQVPEGRYRSKPSSAAELIGLARRNQRRRLAANEFRGLIERVRAFMHSHDLGPVADIGARTAARSACFWTRAGGEGAKKQQKNNRSGSHVILLEPRIR